MYACSANKSPSSIPSDTEVSERCPDEYNEHKVVIFDWDDTLFCTKYLDLHVSDYRELFEEKISIDQLGMYLNHELQNLEEVKISLTLENAWIAF
jgi:hypothetical protein